MHFKVNMIVKFVIPYASNEKMKTMLQEVNVLCCITLKFCTVIHHMIDNVFILVLMIGQWLRQSM